MAGSDSLKTLLVLAVWGAACAPLNAEARKNRPVAGPAPSTHFHPLGQPPSPATVALQRSARSSLPFEDKRDFEESKRGFVAAPTYTEIMTAEGTPAWNFGRYAFLDTKQDFDSIHPSLQRQAVLNMRSTDSTKSCPAGSGRCAASTSPTSRSCAATRAGSCSTRSSRRRRPPPRLHLPMKSSARVPSWRSSTRTRTSTISAACAASSTRPTSRRARCRSSHPPASWKPPSRRTSTPATR